MRVEVLVEPELEFGGAVRHLDVRYGLMQGGPLDVDSPSRRSISVGIVGTTETVEGVSLWLERCRSEIPAKPGPYPELFPRFPGFNLETTFRSSLQMETRLQRTVSQRAIDRLVKPLPSNAEIEEAAELFLDEMRYLSETSRPDVIACAPPFELMQSLKGDDQSAEEEPVEDDGSLKYDFHDLLKARAMGFHAPVQLVWPPTYDASKRRSQKGRTDKVQGVQDDATRAWNLHTAMYYKAGGTPWRLVRDASEFTSCCVGISFYKSLDRQNLFTSMAQVFNERGDGVVVRGGQVKVSKRDRQPHLDASDAEQLLRQALVIYRREHKNLPARIVVHKTSRYSDQELEGFHRAAEQAMVEETDFLSIGRSSVRLFREEEYPPLRGTLLSLDNTAHALYTRGSVNFFRTYPGMYVPMPLLFRCEDTMATPRSLAAELLGLTKMNWNSTRFDGREPITVHGAKQVAAMLRYIGENDAIEPSYSYYM